MDNNTPLITSNTVQITTFPASRKKKSKLTDKCSRTCSKKTFYKRLPILTWLPQYNVECVIGDIMSGITMALTIIPEGLANSIILGVPTQNGLYSCFMGGFVYIFLGSCKDSSVGPTATLTLIASQFVGDRGPEYATLLCFITGVIQLIMGFLGLGFLNYFISEPVSSGFTSAVAMIIFLSQLRHILAIPMEGSTFINLFTSLVKNVKDTSWRDAVLGFSCIAVLLLLRLLTKLDPNLADKNKTISKSRKIAMKFLWFIGISRNAIVVIASSFISYMFLREGTSAFRIVEDVPPGLPSIQVPPFEHVEFDNGTEIYHGFFDMAKEFGSGIIVVPLVALLEDISVCKAFANGKTVDATQELLSIGSANFVTSFFQGFPITGALARSAVNNSSGVRTTLAGLYTGILVIASLLLCTPYFYYIPKATLAALIAAAVIFMIQYQAVKLIWRTNRNDLVPGLTTFFACLVVPIEYGILLGIAINIIFILYHTARPKVSREKIVTDQGLEYLLLTPDRCLIFPSTDYVKNLIAKYCAMQQIPVVIDCTYVYKTDYTTATVIQTLTKEFEARGQPLFFYNLKPRVKQVFQGLAENGIVIFNEECELANLLTYEMNQKYSY